MQVRPLESIRGSQEKAPSHLYTTAGLYTVNLQVTQPDGYTQSYEKQIAIYGGTGANEEDRSKAVTPNQGSALESFLGSPYFIGLAAFVLGAPVVVLLAAKFAKK